MMKTFRSALKQISLLFLFVFASQMVLAAGAATPAGSKGDPAKGKAVFEANCTSCHVLGGVLIGPNLIGVKKRWPDYNKLKDFVHTPAKYIGKDPYVTKLQAAANGAVMNVPPLPEQQIEDVLAYVDQGGVSDGGATSNTSGVSYMPVPADNSGLAYLFVGIVIMLFVVGYLAVRIRNSFPNEGDENHFKGIKEHTKWQKINAFFYIPFLLLFMVGIYWECGLHLPFIRPEAASEIGVEIDRLFRNTLIVTGIVFIVTQILLFWYAFRYRSKEGRKAYFYPHNNTVEFVWTVVPAIVLAFLVLDGFKTWRAANANPEVEPITIEAFAKQFDWTFRYPGPDGKLGRTDFLKIAADNPLGIDFDDPASKDDFLVTDTLRLPKGHDVVMKLRSQDVIHAAYLPHFRMEMYAQPGMDNHMRFKPLYTTDEFRTRIGNPKFNYEMACNQLCGAAHWNMRRVVKIYPQGDYDRWVNGNTHKPAMDSYQANGKTALK